MIGNTVFISYRGAYYNSALEVKNLLLQNGYCRKTVLIPPNTISRENELLRVFEYFELGEMISDYMHGCDAFVFINTPNYLGSYFTQLELHQWRYFWKLPNNPVAISMAQNRNREWNLQNIELTPMPQAQKEFWANIVVGVSRRVQRQRWSTPLAGSKYARKYYVVPCRNCGEHLLLHKKHVGSLIKDTSRLNCPYACGNNSFHFHKHRKRGNFYRKPILLDQAYDNNLRLIEMDEYMSILIQKGKPDKMLVVS